MLWTNIGSMPSIIPEFNVWFNSILFLNTDFDALLIIGCVKAHISAC